MENATESDAVLRVRRATEQELDVLLEGLDPDRQARLRELGTETMEARVAWARGIERTVRVNTARIDALEEQVRALRDEAALNARLGRLSETIDELREIALTTDDGDGHPPRD